MDVFYIGAHSCIRAKRTRNGKAVTDRIELKPGQHIIYTMGTAGRLNFAESKKIYDYMATNRGLTTIRNSIKQDPARFMTNLQQYADRNGKETSAYRYRGPGSTVIDQTYDLASEKYDGVVQAPNSRLRKVEDHGKIKSNINGKDAINIIKNKTNVDMTRVKLSNIIGSREGIFVISACRGLVTTSGAGREVGLVLNGKGGVDLNQPVAIGTRSGKTFRKTTKYPSMTAAQKAYKANANAKPGVSTGTITALVKAVAPNAVTNTASSRPPKIPLKIEKIISEWGPMALGLAASVVFNYISKRSRNSTGTQVSPTLATTPNGRRRWIKNKLDNMSPSERNNLVNSITRKVRSK